MIYTDKSYDTVEEFEKETGLKCFLIVNTRDINFGYWYLPKTKRGRFTALFFIKNYDERYHAKSFGYDETMGIFNDEGNYPPPDTRYEFLL